MSENHIPIRKPIILRSSSDFSLISDISEKKILREVIDRHNPYADLSNATSNNRSCLENLSNYRASMLTSSKKIKEYSSTPLEQDTELHIERKFHNFSPKISKDFDNVPQTPQKPNETEQRQTSLNSPLGSAANPKSLSQVHSDSLASDSDSSINNDLKLGKASLPSNKLESGVLDNAKTRKSFVVSFGAGDKGQFNTEEFEESKLTKKRTIKEEEEEEGLEQVESQKIVISNLEAISERNPDVQSAKSYFKGSRMSKEEGRLHQKTLYSVISNFYLTKKFIHLLRNSTFYRRPKWLKPYHFRMINDWSFWLDGWRILNNEDQVNVSLSPLKKPLISLYLRKGRKFGGRLLKKMQELVPQTFDPAHKFRVLWDILHLLIIIFNIILTPIEIGFDLKEGIMENAVLQFLVEFSLGFFILDIIVNLNTAYYDKGNLIFSKPMIIRHYCSGLMFRDILSFFSQFLGIYYSNQTTKYFDLLILLRFCNLKKIFVTIEEYIAVDEKLYNTISLVKLILGVFFMSHILACLWHFIGIIQGENGKTWLNYYDVQKQEWYIRYIYSYYFVVISMNTVGYGDLVPQTVFERFFIIFFIFFACWIFAYTINSIGIILQDINRKNHDYNRSINLINGYMKQKSINFDLQVRIRKYIQFIWQEEKSHNNLETLRVIDKLSKSLRQELLLQANGIILRELPMFNLNFTEESLRRIVCTMKEVSFIPGDPIYFANDFDDKSLYILRSGEVELFVETPRPHDPYTVIKTLNKKGEVFGEYSFFSDKERESCARSSTFTSVFIIKQQDFLEIIRDSPLDYESFCQIKDQINLYQKYDSLYQRCAICNQNQHFPLECPLLHLVLSKTRIIQRHNYSDTQKRCKGHERRRQKMFHPLKEFEKHENLAQKLHQRLSEEDEDNTSEERVSNNESENLTNATKPSEDNEGNVNERDDSPKFKDLLMRDTSEKKSILKGVTTRTIGSPVHVFTQNSSESKSSMTLPGSEFVERRPEANYPKFFPETGIASIKSKTQIVAFASKDLSSDSLSMNSNFSRRSKIEEARNKRKNIRSTTSEYTKKVSISEDESHNRKSSLRKNNRENSGTFDSRKSQKSSNSEKSNTIGLSSIALLKKVEEQQKETQIFTTTTEKEMQIDDICKSYANYFNYNNVEIVVEKFNEFNERKRKKKKLSKTASKLMGLIESSSSKSPALSPLSKINTRRRMMARSNFFQKKEDENKEKRSKNQNEQRRSIFDKIKIIQFLKEEEKKKTEKMGVWAKMKKLIKFKTRDEELISKYFIRGSSSRIKKKKLDKK